MKKKSNKSRRVNRRTFLKESASALGTLALGSTFTGRAMADLCAAPDGDTLVYVFLRGGFDALSLLAPLAGPDRVAYEALRPNLAIPAGDLLRLANSANLGLNPNAARLRTLYNRNQLNFVMNVGSKNPTTSHFAQQDLIEAGQGETYDSRIRGGFLNRTLSGIPDDYKSKTLPGAAVSTALPKSLRGGEVAVAYSSLTSNQLTRLPGSTLRPGLSLKERLTAMFSLSQGLSKPVDVSVKTQANRAIRASDSLDAAREVTPVFTNEADYAGQMGNFKVALHLLKSDPGVKVITLDVNGWDDHVSLGPVSGSFGTRLKQLSDTLATFVADLNRNKDCTGNTLFSRTTIVVMSEFGRRVKENSAQGTDHGRGGVAMVIGRDLPQQTVQDGFSLSSAKLDQGNLAVLVDYRQVLAEVLEKRVKVKNLNADWQEMENKVSPAIFPDLHPNYKKVLG